MNLARLGLAESRVGCVYDAEVSKEGMVHKAVLTVFLTAGMTLLSGCVSNEFYVKQGVTYDRYERDGVGCATAATQAVPTNTQVGWAPYVGIYSVDTNLPLRDKNMEICMRDRGYQKMPVPYCTGAAATAATEQSKLPRDRSRRMTVNANSCYVMDAKGEAYLYTP